MDPFTLEIIKNALVGAGDEMFTTLQRTAQSSLIFEVLDFAVGATDGEGNLITQGNGVPGFIGTLDKSVESVIAKHGPDGQIQPDDVFLTNDPYGGGGTHLSDVSIIMPVFYGDELVAFTVNKAHWSELGGKDPGSVSADATEIYQEGLQLPNIKLFNRGEPDQAVIDLLAANVRLPHQTLGDMWAGVAAARMGARRITDLIDKYGLATFRAAVADQLDYGERMVRLELAKLPKGTFEAEDWLDDDGMGNGPFRIKVAVTIADDGVTFDYTGCCAQTPGPVNLSYTGLLCAARLIFKAITNPEIPVNGGTFRPVRLICPEGTIFSAQRPAAISIYYEALSFATDVAWKALAPHMPDRLPAGHLVSICATKIYGNHPDTGDFWMIYEPLQGGWGASQHKDGETGQFCVMDGETYNIPVEIAEMRNGVVIDQFAIHNEDGGAGMFRGGKGQVLDYRVVADEAFLTAILSRNKFLPWGVAGGKEGSPNYVEVLRKDGSVERYGSTPEGLRVEKDEVIRVVTATGGGFGDPGNRPRERVLDDLKNEYLTPEQAGRHYGIVSPASL
ncbi:MAG: hydantoinase B/oxoprolinase family protein [Alphaproteobacteria bacterium]